MSNQDDCLKQVNGEISAIAAHIASHRDLIEEMRANGRDTVVAESALQALKELYRHRLKLRRSRQQPQAAYGAADA